MRPVLRLAALFLAAVGSASALTVVPSVVVLQDQGAGAFPGRYAFSLYQDAAKTDYTGAWFSYDTTARRLAWNTSTIDESSDWYFVAAGQTFAWAGIAAGDHVRLTDPAFAQTLAFDQPYGDFYLGAATGRGFTGGKPNRTVLAWVRLHASASGLTLVDSAGAYDAGSIVAGTLNATAIPEPASASALAGICALGLVRARRRRR